MVVLMFGTLLGFTALSVDIGLIRVVSTQMQATLDAAALSGSGELDGTLAGIERARVTAIDIAARNPVIQRTVRLDVQNVEVGTWNNETFTVFGSGGDPVPVNAVRIIHVDPPLPAVLGGIAFGAAEYAVTGSTLAIRPTGAAGSSECFLPLAIPDCHLSGVPAGTNPPPFTFTFNPSPTDSVAWGNPAANPNSNFLRDQLENPCAGNPVGLGDFMQVNEGVHNSANHSIAGILNGASPTPTFWDTGLYGPLPPPDPSSSVAPANYGHTLEGPVVFVDGGTNCAAVSFTGAMRVTGIGYGMIFDVVDGGGDKKIRLQVDFVHEHRVFGTTDDDAVGKNVIAIGPPALESE